MAFSWRRYHTIPLTFCSHRTWFEICTGGAKVVLGCTFLLCDMALVHFAFVNCNAKLVFDGVEQNCWHMNGIDAPHFSADVLSCFFFVYTVFFLYLLLCKRVRITLLALESCWHSDIVSSVHTNSNTNAQFGRIEAVIMVFCSRTKYTHYIICRNTQHFIFINGVFSCVQHVLGKLILYNFSF